MANQRQQKQSQSHPCLLCPMQAEQQQPEECGFCCSMPADRRPIFASLFLALAKELQKMPAIQESSEWDCSPFRQLMRILFANEPHLEGQCQHRRYYTQEQYYLRYFMIKLKCSEVAFLFACQKVAEKMAEKNYHLELLSLQVKNAAQTIAKGMLQVGQEKEGTREVRKGLRRRSSKKSRTTVDNSQRSIRVEPNQPKQAERREEAAEERASFLPAFNSEIPAPQQNQLAMNQLNNIGYFFPQFPFFFTQQNQ